jgi:hypothetical protein
MPLVMVSNRFAYPLSSFLSHLDATVPTRCLLSTVTKDLADGKGLGDAAKDALKDVALQLGNLIGGPNGSAIGKAIGDVRLSYDSCWNELTEVCM